MLSSIKKYFQKAKQEAAKETTISSSGRETAVQSGLPESEDERPPSAWTGVDLDGTLARWEPGSSLESIGEPVPAMMALVRKMIRNGVRVKIFTARASDPEQYPLIREWMEKNGLPKLEITNIKDYYMQRLYDDRCIQVEKNTGRLIKEH